jgi:hypothetical protein
MEKLRADQWADPWDLWVGSRAVSRAALKVAQWVFAKAVPWAFVKAAAWAGPWGCSVWK